ncbi:MAG: class I SAM-dependent rRNA methyltransferase [Phycisphaerae bacterium]
MKPTRLRNAAPADAEHGRMRPIVHNEDLPWVQLRNANFSAVVFQKMIGRIAPTARNGDLVRVYDRDGTVFGAGLLNTHSQIALRMLSYDATPLDESFLSTRLAAAIALRQDILRLNATSEAWRVVHAEGDGLPGLIVDRFGPCAVVELFSVAMQRRMKQIRECLVAQLGVEHVLFRADEHIQLAEGFKLPALAANPPESSSPASTIIAENAVRFQIDLAGGHKTGFFCDQRDNRLALTRFTAEADVLDMCCYSGGFGIYAALLGKAKHVTAVDLDENAIALARRNANLNRIAPNRYETVHADSFPYLRQMQQNNRIYDVIVLDPPKLIGGRLEFAEGRQKYFDLNKLALPLIKPGGILVTCSCSGLVDMAEFQNIVRGAARSARRRVQIIQATGPGMDHPVMTDYPESGYLKCLWCRVM